jgi:hypothetical protein
MKSRSFDLAVSATIMALSAAVLAGCGSSAQKRQAQQLENVSVLSNTAPLGERLVKQSEVESASDTAAVHTFLRLWSLLQFEAWGEAEQLFEPGLRKAVGPALVAQALAADLAVWQGTKPKIVTARTTGPTALIMFLARSETGSVTPASISFERTSGSWFVSYFSPLDTALQRWVQTRTQAQLEPLATKPSPEAVRQGVNALALQSTYLEHRAPATRGRAGATKP